MTLKDKQKDVDEWISQSTTGYFPPLSILAQISEEIGELARELNDRYGGRIKKDADNKTEIESEICDIMFALICLANSHNIDLDESWERTIGARMKRDKERYKKKD